MITGINIRFSLIHVAVFSLCLLQFQNLPTCGITWLSSGPRSARSRTYTNSVSAIFGKARGSSETTQRVEPRPKILYRLKKSGRGLRSCTGSKFQYRPPPAHGHRTSEKSQQATLDFNNYTTKLSNYTLRKATHDGVCVEISQTSGLTGNRNAFAHAWLCFSKVAWASRWWQIRESHCK